MYKEKPRVLTPSQSVGVGIAILFVALTAGLYLGQVSSSNVTSFAGANQLAAVGNVVPQIFQCSVSSVIVTAQNTVKNPVIVPVAGNGQCDPTLPVANNSGNILLDGGYGIMESSLIDSGGNSLDEEASLASIKHGAIKSNKDYPLGYYEFYYQDPVTPPGGETPDGEVSLLVSYRLFPKVSVSDVLYSKTDTTGIDAQGKPIMANPASSAIYHILPNQRPFISFSYTAKVKSGAKVLEQVLNEKGAILLERQVIITSPSTKNQFSFTPTAPLAAGDLYFASVCPLKSSGKIDGGCLTRVFAVEDVSIPKVSVKEEQTKSFSFGPQNVYAADNPPESECKDANCIIDVTGVPTGPKGYNKTFPNPNPNCCNVGKPGKTGRGTNIIEQFLVCPIQNTGPWYPRGLNSTSSPYVYDPTLFYHLNLVLHATADNVEVPGVPVPVLGAYKFIVGVYPQGTGTADFRVSFPPKQRTSLIGRLANNLTKKVDNLGEAFVIPPGSIVDIKLQHIVPETGTCKGEKVPIEVKTVASGVAFFVGPDKDGKKLTLKGIARAGLGTITNAVEGSARFIVPKEFQGGISTIIAKITYSARSSENKGIVPGLYEDALVYDVSGASQ